MSLLIAAITLPIEVVAPVVGALAVAVVVLWGWGLKLLKDNKILQDRLLEAKEELVRILLSLKDKVDEKLRRRYP